MLEHIESVDTLITFVLKTLKDSRWFQCRWAGRWIRWRQMRHRIQLPVHVEIISNLSKFSRQTWWECPPYSRWVQVHLKINPPRSRSTSDRFDWTAVSSSSRRHTERRWPAPAIRPLHCRSTFRVSIFCPRSCFPPNRPDCAPAGGSDRPVDPTRPSRPRFQRIDPVGWPDCLTPNHLVGHWPMRTWPGFAWPRSGWSAFLWWIGCLCGRTTKTTGTGCPAKRYAYIWTHRNRRTVPLLSTWKFWRNSRSFRIFQNFQLVSDGTVRHFDGFRYRMSPGHQCLTRSSWGVAAGAIVGPPRSWCRVMRVPRPNAPCLLVTCDARNNERVGPSWIPVAQLQLKPAKHTWALRWSINQ